MHSRLILWAYGTIHSNLFVSVDTSKSGQMRNPSHALRLILARCQGRSFPSRTCGCSTTLAKVLRFHPISIETFCIPARPTVGFRGFSVVGWCSALWRAMT